MKEEFVGSEGSCKGGQGYRLASGTAGSRDGSDTIRIRFLALPVSQLRSLTVGSLPSSCGGNGCRSSWLIFLESRPAGKSQPQQSQHQDQSQAKTYGSLPHKQLLLHRKLSIVTLYQSIQLFQ